MYIHIHDICHSTGASKLHLVLYPLTILPSDQHQNWWISGTHLGSWCVCSSRGWSCLTIKNSIMTHNCTLYINSCSAYIYIHCVYIYIYIHTYVDILYSSLKKLMTYNLYTYHSWSVLDCFGLYVKNCTFLPWQSMLPGLSIEAPFEDPEGHGTLRCRRGTRSVLRDPLAPPVDGCDEVQSLREDLRVFARCLNWFNSFSKKI